MTDDRRWLAVEAAAREVGIPARTVYNWARSKKLAPKKDGKRLLVEIGAVRSLAATRAANDGALPEADIAGTGAGNHAKSGKVAPNGSGVAETDGELSARAIERLEAGGLPMDLVRDLHIPADRALALYRDYLRLKQIEKGEKPGQPDRVAKLEATVADLRNSLNYLATELREQDIRHFVSRHDELLKRLQEMLRPERCQRCGGTLYVVLPVGCDMCDARLERPIDPPPRSGY